MRGGFGFLIVCATLAGGPARADQVDPDTEIAQRHFMAGAAAYDRADYPTALREFQEAQRVKPLPAFEFNIARTLDRMERVGEAITHYERYLKGNPPDADEVRERLATLKSRQTDLAAARAADEKARAEKEAVARTLAEQRAAERRRWEHDNAFGRRFLVPLVIGGAALAVGVAGAAVLGTVTPDFARLDAGPLSCRPCTASAYSGIQTRAYTGYALLGVAGALAVVDVALWIWKARRHPSPSFAGTIAGVRF